MLNENLRHTQSTGEINTLGNIDGHEVGSVVVDAHVEDGGDESRCSNCGKLVYSWYKRCPKCGAIFRR